MKTNISVGKHIYFMSGDISYYFLADTHVMLFNKKTFEDVSEEYPYQTVRDGKWTFDEMKRLAEVGTYDLNGDSEINADDDHIGYITTRWRGPQFCYIAEGTRLVTIEDGTPKLTMNRERAETIYSRYLDFLKSDSAFLYKKAEVEDANLMKLWMSGRFMFYDGLIKYISIMRDMKDDFGILPLPKYDEAQSAYLSTPGAGINLYAVPITNSDTAGTSLILEAMAILGHEDIIPTYYETILKSKYARDDESAEMLDLIRENIIVDLGTQIYDQNTNPITSIGWHLSVSKKDTFVTFWERNIAKFEKCLDEVIEKVNA